MTAADDREVTPARSVPLATKTWDIQPLLAAAEARGVERGYRRATVIVAAALAEAKAEPRRPPTERAGRICALGQLLATLEASEGTTP